MLRVLIISFLVSIPLALAQQPGSCPKITGLGLNPQRAVGVWYSHSVSPNAKDKALECGRVTWYQPNGLNFTLLFESISTITNEVSSVVVEGNANSHTFRHHVPVLGEVDADNYILGRDYDRWAVMYQCNSQGNTHSEKGWVLTRERFPDETRLNQFVDQSYRRWGLQKPEFLLNSQNCQF